MFSLRWYCWSALLLCPVSWQLSLADEPAKHERHSIQAELVHLRSGSEREWSEFPQSAQGKRFEKIFTASKNANERALLVRQQDVKQLWTVSLNGHKLGELVRDENDMVIALAIPPGGLVDGKNALTIESPPAKGAASDDICVGELAAVDCPVRELLREATVEVEVTDSDSGDRLPCRITVLNADGAMQSTGAESNDHLAVRPGIVYSSTGQATIGLPAGRYTIYAGRGFEYSLAQAEVTVKAGETATVKLAIRREVPTDGYVASDTHVHTLTHSGHGDATIDERMITLAGEGVELPIATDHNKHIDYEEVAAKMGVRRYFTPVMGNEVTTPRGHFNIFPVAAGAKIVDYRQSDWGLLFDEIWRTPDVKVVILNHARDTHSGVRPFGPEHFNALVGENLDGWPMRFNAMETINSGATQTYPLQLLHDWAGLLNHGMDVTPIGSSDSHDVGRHFVGQGRTYVRCDDRDASRIDVDAAVSSFVSGQVMVSYGLLAEITVGGQYRSGQLATGQLNAGQLNAGQPGAGQGAAAEQVRIDVRVLGPHWSEASYVELWANGQVIREADIAESSADGLPPGVKWTGTWTIPKPPYDVHLVAVATGPGTKNLYWPTAKPYQPLSPDWMPTTLGCSGAVWVDGDNDGRRTSAREYAERIVARAGQDWPKLVLDLARYDEAVAAQVAHLLNRSGVSLQAPSLVEALKKATGATKAGFQAYREALRENELARVRP
ncbi:MAG: CehA/McbA family metallohydrolase [Aureliella sp.]